MVEKSLIKKLKRISMKYLFRIITTILIVAVLFPACKKRDDYFIGGSLHNPKVNMSTYDYLKSNSAGLFDTLLLLIDKAGLKDKVNQQGVTFFAPTDYSINTYLTLRALEEQNIDPNRKWTIDSMIKYEMPKFIDSINIYFVNQVLTYDKLTENGAVYPTLKTGANCVVSYEETRDPTLGYNPNVSTIPRLVYFTFLLKDPTPPIIASEIQPDEGVHTLVQTSSIETTTGILNVLQNGSLGASGVNGHALFFRNN
jgi:hypothetical protein